jgi:hypothetical protein
MTGQHPGLRILALKPLYLVSMQLVRTWIISHLKHQDVLYCTWEVYTCMIRQECNAQTIEIPSLLCYRIYRYIPCLFGIWWYIPVQVSMKTSYRYIPGYTTMYEMVWSCTGGGDSRCSEASYIAYHEKS